MNKYKVGYIGDKTKWTRQYIKVFVNWKNNGELILLEVKKDDNYDCKTIMMEQIDVLLIDRNYWKRTEPLIKNAEHYGLQSCIMPEIKMNQAEQNSDLEQLKLDLSKGAEKFKDFRQKQKKRYNELYQKKKKQDLKFQEAEEMNKLEELLGPYETLEEPYSYHTFMLPFVLKKAEIRGESSKKKSIFEHNITEKFADLLSGEKTEDYGKMYWTEYKSPLFQEEFVGDSEEQCCKQYEESRLAYAVYQYYNTPARKAIGLQQLNSEETPDRILHNMDSNHGSEWYDVSNESKDIRNFQLDFHNLAKKEKQNEEAIRKYSIDVTDSSNGQQYHYDLLINNITLRLYPIGIAILVYELENWDFSRLEDVKNINEYGRRVQLACMNPATSFKLTADKLTVCGIEENFKEIVKTYYKKPEGNKIKNPWGRDLNYLSKTVVDLFKNEEGKNMVSTSDDADVPFVIEPYVDDRMFVHCLVSDGNLIPYNQVKYRDVTSIEKCGCMSLKELYEFTFIDKDGGLSCQNRAELEKDLEDVLYTRWIEYGTLQGITPYSMVCITGAHKMVADSVINPFLTIYKELVQLVLIQRAAIIMFAEKAALLSYDLQRSKKREDDKDKSGISVMDRIAELQKDYVAFQNQLQLFEVTSQLQGIELYHKLQEKMEIANQEKEMEKQLQNLFEISQTEQGDKTNEILNIMTVFGLLFTGLQIVQAQFADFSEKMCLNNIFFLFGLFVVGFSVYQSSMLNGKGKFNKLLSNCYNKVLKGRNIEVSWMIIVLFIITIIILICWANFHPELVLNKEKAIFFFL